MRPVVEGDAGYLSRRKSVDPALVQVALLTLLAILILTTTALFGGSS